MLTFAVVVSRGRHPVPGGVVEQLRRAARDDLPFAAGSHLVWSNVEGTVWFAGWQDSAEPRVTAHHWHADRDGGLTAFAGHVWPRLHGWSGTGGFAEQLAEFTGSSKPTDAADLGGVFVAVRLDRRGAGQVFTNPLGIGVAYHAGGEEIVVVSTRAALAAHLLAAAEPNGAARDALGVGWLAYCTHAMGASTGFTRVEALPPGARVCIEGAGGGADVVLPERSVWRPGDAQGATTEELVAEAETEMEVAVRMALRAPAATRCADLTGGKDSRLLLAVLLSTGVAQDVEFQTLGDDDLPDVVIARRLAAQLGLRHRTNPDRQVFWDWYQDVEAAVRADSPRLSSREISFRITTWAASGVSSVAEPLLGRLRPADRSVYTGLFGEALRTNYPAITGLRSKRALARRFPRALSAGRAGILRPEVTAHYRAELHRLLFADALPADGPDDVADVFFLRNRLHRWFGAKQELDGQRHHFPLGSLAGVRLAFAIGGENRHSQWIHRRIMSDACAALVDVPFAKGGWGAGAGDLVPRRGHRDAVPAAPPRWVVPPALSLRGRGLRRRPQERMVSSDQLAARRAADVEVMRDLLDDPANPVSELLDAAAVRRALDGFDGLGDVAQRQVYGAATAAIWLSGREIALPHR
jgi:hypothetical protein